MTVNYTTQRPGIESLTYWPQVKSICEKYGDPMKSFVFSSSWISRTAISKIVLQLGGTVVRTYSQKSYNRVVFHFPDLDKTNLALKIQYLQGTCLIPTTSERRHGPVTVDQAKWVKIHRAARTRLSNNASKLLNKATA